MDEGARASSRRGLTRQWSTIADFADPPFELTVKSNGCIIFIAALTADSLIVTSKHSVGGQEGRDFTHAQRGEFWLDKHLAQVGKTRKELAERLWTGKLTAVAEVRASNRRCR